MTTKNLRKHLVIYETPFTQITSVEQARVETAFLHKAYSLGIYNKILYFGGGKGGGFHSSVNAKNINQQLEEIVEDAKAGNLPSRYSIGLNIDFDGKIVNTRIFEKE